MTPQERDVIAGIFDRLKAAQNQPRDPEAERLIAEKIAAQPYAPYALAQSVYVQEQALLNMQQQIEALQGEVEALRNQPQPSGGFLGGLFGGRPQAPAQNAAPHLRAGTGPSTGRPMGAPGMMGAGPQAAPQPGAFGQQAAQAPASGPWGQRQGGGFLQTAMATAAGVAGGMVLGNVLMNAFGGGQTPAGAETATAPAEAAPAAEAYQPASIGDESFADPGFDDGGDWA